MVSMKYLQRLKVCAIEERDLSANCVQEREKEELPKTDSSRDTRFYIVRELVFFDNFLLIDIKN